MTANSAAVAGAGPPPTRRRFHFPRRKGGERRPLPARGSPGRSSRAATGRPLGGVCHTHTHGVLPALSSGRMRMQSTPGACRPAPSVPIHLPHVNFSTTSHPEKKPLQQCVLLCLAPSQVRESLRRLPAASVQRAVLPAINQCEIRLWAAVLAHTGPGSCGCHDWPSVSNPRAGTQYSERAESREGAANRGHRSAVSSPERGGRIGRHRAAPAPRHGRHCRGRAARRRALNRLGELYIC